MILVKRRGKLVRNVFCPTGEGGGVDDSCGRDGGDTLTAPKFVFGDVPVHPEEFNAYLKQAGAKVWPSQPLPADVERGTPKECFKNATLCALEHGYDYCEGIAIPKDLNLPFLHAWCVDKQGKVVDPTWDKPEDAKYYGVKYDKKAYMAHIHKTGMYGVFGGSSKVAREIVKRGHL